MGKIVIHTSHSTLSEKELKAFYDGFLPDDWDHIVIGERLTDVEDVTQRLTDGWRDYYVRQVDTDGVAYMGVTYHA